MTTTQNPTAITAADKLRALVDLADAARTAADWRLVGDTNREIEAMLADYTGLPILPDTVPAAEYTPARPSRDARVGAVTPARLRAMVNATPGDVFTVAEYMGNARSGRRTWARSRFAYGITHGGIGVRQYNHNGQTIAATVDPGRLVRIAVK